MAWPNWLPEPGTGTVSGEFPFQVPPLLPHAPVEQELVPATPFSSATLTDEFVGQVTAPGLAQAQEQELSYGPFQSPVPAAITAALGKH